MPTAASARAIAANAPSSNPVRRGVASAVPTTSVIGRMFATGRFGSICRISLAYRRHKSKRVRRGPDDEEHVTNRVATGGDVPLAVRNVELLLHDAGDAVMSF